jgi:NTE family protein
MAAMLGRVICLALISTGCIWPQQQPPRRKIGVALQGGGAKGLAHIGVLEWLESRHIPIDYLAGTSMGGLVGGLYATGHSPEEIKRIVSDIDWNSVISGETPYRELAFRRKEDLRALPNGLELGLRQGVQPPGGLVSGQSVQFIIDRYMLPYSDGRSFDLLPTPFRCVATDLVSSKPVVFKDGSLSTALRATMSLPGIFSPVKQDGKILADGGLLNNLPTDVVRQMGADVVIGVHLAAAPVVPTDLRSFFQVAGGSINATIAANEMHGMEGADILITIDVAGYSTLDFSRNQQIIPLGYQAAQARAGVLESLRLTDEEWARYVAARDAKVIKTVPAPTFVKVEGAGDVLDDQIEKQFSSMAGNPVDIPGLQSKLTQLNGLGWFETLSYSLVTQDKTQGLLISAQPKDYAPPWLKPGFVIDGSDPDNVQFTLGARITLADLGGVRSELRTDLSIGATYSASSEYYHPFTNTSRWFIAPGIHASRSSLNLYLQNTLLAEYKITQFDGTFDLGYAIDRFSEFRLGYDAGYLKASRRIGGPILPAVSGRTGVTRARYVMDRLDNPIIPRRGIALFLNGGWNDAYPGASRGYPSAQATLQAFRKVTNPASIYLIAEGGTVFGHHQTGLPLFSLGGPGRMAAYGVNQFLTNQYFYLRGGYLHRIAALPSFLGSGIYADVHFETGQTYGLSNSHGLLYDGTAGLVMQTVLGPVLIGGSVGESGNGRWFFQLGRVF